MKKTDNLPVRPFASADAFATWLRKNHEKTPGVWLKIAKKDSGIASITYPQAVEIALCFGWIDGQMQSVDSRCVSDQGDAMARRSAPSEVEPAKPKKWCAIGRRAK